MSLSYRRPLLSEADDLAALHVRCWQEAYAGILDGDFLRDLPREYRARIWRQAIPDAGMHVMAASAGGHYAGFVMSGPANTDYRKWADGEIHALYLLKAYQRQGIGRRLFMSASENWQQRGGRKLVAMVFNENHNARRFYAAMGGAAQGEVEIAFGGMKLKETAYVFDL